jgi:ABC-type transport system involved in cytochrome bd biosynthesis fused ATPase/permease subunit
MRGYVTIDTPEGFQAWLDEEGKKLSGEDAAWN